MMSLDALGNIGDFLGGLAVVVTLAYLAVQVRRNTAEVRLRTATSQWDGIRHAFDPLYYGDNAEVLRRGLTDRDSLSVEDLFVWGMLMARLFGQFEMSCYQARNGALDDELFAMHSRLIETLIQTPGALAWWAELGRSTVGESFRAYVDDLISNPSEHAQRVAQARARRAV